MRDDLADARLGHADHRQSSTSCFERRETERFTHRRQNEHVALREYRTNLADFYSGLVNAGLKERPSWRPKSLNEIHIPLSAGMWGTRDQHAMADERERRQCDEFDRASDRATVCKTRRFPCATEAGSQR